jgi:hypothetical protein
VHQRFASAGHQVFCRSLVDAKSVIFASGTRRNRADCFGQSDGVSGPCNNADSAAILDSNRVVRLRVAGPEKLIAKECQQPNLAGRWSLYAPQKDCWFPVVYRSKIEALAALKALQMAGAALIG